MIAFNVEKVFSLSHVAHGKKLIKSEIVILNLIKKINLQKQEKEERHAFCCLCWIHILIS